MITLTMDDTPVPADHTVSVGSLRINVTTEIDPWATCSYAGSQASIYEHVCPGLISDAEEYPDYPITKMAVDWQMLENQTGTNPLRLLRILEASDRRVPRSVLVPQISDWNRANDRAGRHHDWLTNGCVDMLIRIKSGNQTLDTTLLRGVPVSQYWDTLNRFIDIAESMQNEEDVQ